MSKESPQNASKVTYRRLLSYTFKWKGVFAISVTSMILVALSQPAFARLMELMLDDGFIGKDPEIIKWIPAAVVGVFIARAVSGFASDYGMAWIGRTVIQTLRTQMFERLLVLPNQYYDNTSTGETISRFTFDVEQLAHAATTAVTILIKDFLMVAGLIAYMFYKSPKLAVVFLILGPIIALLIALISKRFRLISKRIQSSMGTITHVLEESVQAQRVVKIFGGQKYELDRFNGNNNKNRQQNLKLIVASAASTSILQLIVAIALAVIVYIAIQEGVKGQISPGVFTGFMAAMMMLFAPIKRLTNVNAVIQKGIAAAESVFDFLDIEPESAQGDFSTQRVKGELKFDNVNFTYSSNQDKQVLKNINLHISPGETVAFVGRSGSGKSTLVNLIPRLYDGYQGDIFLDGVSIKDYRLENLRHHIAYVGQEIVLFNDTIAHNISYGSDVSDDKIRQAAISAHALEFIDKLPEGMQSLAGEKGVLLSGGQRQRLAIARALLKDAPVLIMDEATSALDTESERAIQDALETLTANRTTLIIAHRLSTIENADKIVVMDQGTIVEVGSHSELLAKSGAYCALHSIQFADNDES